LIFVAIVKTLRNKGNFVEILKLIAKYDRVINEHLSGTELSNEGMTATYN